MVSHAIEVRILYKIFGPRGGDYVVAVKNGLGKAELNQPDRIHPTPAGHQIVAQNIWSHLKPLLK